MTTDRNRTGGPFRSDMSDGSGVTADRPIHGDVWRSPVARRNFTVLHVCGRCKRPMVTGHWWRSGSLDPNLHDSIPLSRFMSAMTLVEREDA